MLVGLVLVWGLHSRRGPGELRFGAVVTVTVALTLTPDVADILTKLGIAGMRRSQVARGDRTGCRLSIGVGAGDGRPIGPWGLVVDGMARSWDGREACRRRVGFEGKLAGFGQSSGVFAVFSPAGPTRRRRCGCPWAGRPLLLPTAVIEMRRGSWAVTCDKIRGAVLEVWGTKGP